jgi:hypothetical protein
MSKSHLTINIHLRNEGQEGKTSLSSGRYQWEVGGQKETVKEGKYGRCILYMFIVIEQ